MEKSHLHSLVTLPSYQFVSSITQYVSIVQNIMQQVLTNTASSPSPGAWPSELAGAGKVEAGRGLAGAGWLLATASSGKAAPGSWVGGGGEGLVGRGEDAGGAANRLLHLLCKCELSCSGSEPVSFARRGPRRSCRVRTLCDILCTTLAFQVPESIMTELTLRFWSCGGRNKTSQHGT